jgi:DNA-binding transcriptional LysR family regulator
MQEDWQVCRSRLRQRNDAPMLDWNDFRMVLTIARAGGLVRAAEALGVNHSTVFRRLNGLEEQLGVQLFERLPGGYEPTDAGAQLVAAGERIEAETLALERDLAGRDARLRGRLRVTSSETLAFRVLTAEIVRFRAAHPGIQVEVVIENRQLDLSRREADLAFRATRPTQGDLFGRKLADIAWAVYGADTYLAMRGVPAASGELAAHAMIGWDSAASTVKAVQWLAGTVPESAIVYRSSSLINQLLAVKAGIGLAVLPCYLADPEPDLCRALTPIPELTRELWLITHETLKGTARVRAFMEIVGEGVRRRLAALERRPQAAAAAAPVPAPPEPRKEVPPRAR